MESNLYFECECIYHKKGVILCDTCETITNKDNRDDDDGFITVRRWRKRKANKQEHHKILMLET